MTVFDHPHYNKARQMADELAEHVRAGRTLSAIYLIMPLVATLERINRAQEPYGGEITDEQNRKAGLRHHHTMGAEDR